MPAKIKREILGLFGANSKIPIKIKNPRKEALIAVMIAAIIVKDKKIPIILF